MRLRYLLTDWLAARKYRRDFRRAQACASWKTDLPKPHVTAPRDTRKQFRRVLLWKKSA